MSLSRLCRTCQQALCPDLLEASSPDSRRRGSHHMTHKAYVLALSSGCVICMTVEKATERKSRAMSNIPSDDWIPWSYTYELIAWTDIVWFSIQIYDGISGVGTESMESVNFYLYPHHSWLQKCLLDLPVYYKDSQASSESALDLAILWKENCLKRHPDCKQLQENKCWWPTRLIDIGCENNELWKIVSLPKNLQPPPIYITLSYRWGEAVQLRLLKENKNFFFGGLPIMNLPRTFQDAITVARKFSVRYLWIDALCIVQDCFEDWARESRSMRRVYANALCNLAAVASSDPNGGLFRTRDPEIIRPSLVRASLDRKSPPQDYYIVDTKYAERQVLETELMKRGWVFQERLLCPRVLYFTEEQVFWECFVEQRCETFPNGTQILKSSKAKTLSRILRLTDAGVTIGERSMWEAISVWRDLVVEYTKCKLTKASDKLFAMEGIADLFWAYFHDDYAFGLWRTHFVHQLGYFVECPWPESSTNCVAPSWSWASLQSPVNYSTQYVNIQTAFAQVLDLDPLQRVLRLCGHILRAKPTRPGPSKHVVLTVGCSQVDAHIYPDRRDIEANMPEEIVIMPILSELDLRSAKKPALYCLVLEPILVTTAESYRRIALLLSNEWKDLAFFGLAISNDGYVRMVGGLSDINLM